MIFLYHFFLYKRKVRSSLKHRVEIAPKQQLVSLWSAAGQQLVNSWSIVFKINTRLATLYFIVIYNILYHIN